MNTLKKYDVDKYLSDDETQKKYYSDKIQNNSKKSDIEIS